MDYLYPLPLRRDVYKRQAVDQQEDFWNYVNNDSYLNDHKGQYVELSLIHISMDGMPQLFPDKIHPNEEGAKVMAKAVYQSLKSKIRVFGCYLYTLDESNVFHHS